MCALQTPVKPRFQWAPNWKVCAFSALLLPILIGLGFWQLQRADEKRTLQQSLELEQAKAPVPILSLQNPQFSKVLPMSFNYRQVIASGHFLRDYYWLLENKTVNGRIGFEVVMPYVIASEGLLEQSAYTIVLVNRGWVQGGGHRGELPQLVTPSGPVEIVGQVALPSTNVLHAGAEVEAQWPKRVLGVQPEAFIEALKQEDARWQTVLPFVLYLSEHSTGVLTPNWTPVVMPAYKHVGYAVQWFSMALALLVLTLFANSNLASVLKR